MLYSVSISGAGAPIFLVAPSLRWVQEWAKVRSWECLGAGAKEIPTITRYGKLTNKELGAIKVGPRYLAKNWGPITLGPKAQRLARESQGRPTPHATAPAPAHRAVRWQRGY